MSGETGAGPRDGGGNWDDAMTDGWSGSGVGARLGESAGHQPGRRHLGGKRGRRRPPPWGFGGHR